MAKLLDHRQRFPVVTTFIFRHLNYQIPIQSLPLPRRPALLGPFLSCLSIPLGSVSILAKRQTNPKTLRRFPRFDCFLGLCSGCFSSFRIYPPAAIRPLSPAGDFRTLFYTRPYVVTNLRSRMKPDMGPQFHLQVMRRAQGVGNMEPMYPLSRSYSDSTS